MNVAISQSASSTSSPPIGAPSLSTILGANIQQTPSAIKAMCSREMRKPGKTNEAVFAHLAKLECDEITRRSVIQDLIEDAKRLKKQQLVDQLAQMIE